MYVYTRIEREGEIMALVPARQPSADPSPQASGLKHAMPYHTIYDTMIYYDIPYYTILHYTILDYTILYCTILYYTILWFTRLYYTILL